MKKILLPLLALNFAALPVAKGEFISMTSGVTNVLTDVWGTSPNDVWAVGSGGVILHYNGNISQAWTRMGEGLTTTNLHSVAGNSPTNVFAAAGGFTDETVILRYNGSSWSIISSPANFGRVTDIWMADSGELYAVGFSPGFNIPGAAVFKDGAWRSMWLQSGGTDPLFAVVGINATNVLAAKGIGSGMYRYDGNALISGSSTGRWSSITFPGSIGWLGAIVNSPEPHQVFGVTQPSMGNPSLISYNYSNGVLSQLSLPSASSLIAVPREVWGSALANLYMAGQDGSGAAKLARYNGSVWQAQTLPVTTGGTGLNAVWGFNTNDVFAVGQGGTIIRFLTTPPPNISVADASVVEGDSGTTNLAFSVTLSRTTDQAVAVNFFTTNGTATPGSDYTATNGVLTFAPGETNKAITVVVNGDTDPESNETLTLLLSSPSNAAIQDSSAVGRILDDDTPPTLYVTGGRVKEGNSGTRQAVFRVQLNHAWKMIVSVDYSTSNTGTATPGADYVSGSGSVSFAPGETRKTFTVTIAADTVVESNETFGVVMANAVNATLAYTNLLGLIGDDDLLLAGGDVLTIVKTDDPVPGEPGRFFRKFIGTPVLNRYNEVAFLATTDTAANDTPRTNLWLGTWGSLRKIAESGCAAPQPAPGGVYTGQFDSIDLDDDGNVLFFAGVDSTAQVDMHRRGTFPGPANATVLLVSQGIADLPFALAMSGQPPNSEAVQELIHDFAGVGGADSERARIKDSKVVFAGKTDQGNSFAKQVDLKNGTEKVIAKTGQKLENGRTISDVSSGPIGTDGTVTFFFMTEGSPQPPNIVDLGWSDANTEELTTLEYGDPIGEFCFLGVFPFIGTAAGGDGAFTVVADKETTLPTESLSAIVRRMPDGSIEMSYVPPNGGLPPPVIEASVDAAGHYCAYNVLTYLPGSAVDGVHRETHDGMAQNERVFFGGMRIPVGGTVSSYESVTININRLGVISFCADVNDGSGDVESLISCQPGFPPEIILQTGTVNTLDGNSFAVQRMYVPSTAGGAPEYLNDDNRAAFAGNTESASSNPEFPFAGFIGQIAVAATPTNPPTTIQFSQATDMVSEGQTNELIVTRTGDVSGTSEVTVWLYSGTAKRVTDFRGLPDGDIFFITFNPGETMKSYLVATINDSEAEGDEVFYARLADFVNALPGDPGVAEITIIDNEPPPVPLGFFEPPIISSNFVALPWSGDFPYTLSEPQFYVQHTKRLQTQLDSEFENLPGAASPMMIAHDSVEDAVFYMSDLGTNAFFRLIASVTAGAISGKVLKAGGEAWEGVLRVGESGKVTATDAQGNYQLTNVPSGRVPLALEDICVITRTNAASSNVIYRVVTYVNLASGTETIVDFKVATTKETIMPPCDCAPRAAIGVVYVGGARTIWATGGKFGDCEDGPVVTLTGPGYSGAIDGKPLMVDSPADGTWTVTSIICGVTNSSSVTLP